MQDHLGAAHHQDTGDLGHRKLAAGDHGEAAELGVDHGECALDPMVRDIRIHEIMRGGPGCGVDAPEAQQHLAARAYEKATIEESPGPVRVDLELVGGNIDAAPAGGRLQRLADPAGDWIASLVDPVGDGAAVRRSLQAEFWQDNQPGRRVARAGCLDHGDGAIDVALDDLPRRIAAPRLGGEELVIWMQVARQDLMVIATRNRW
jgi:hypothetical protein